MAIELPGWLVEAIRYLGYEFPQTNEDQLHTWADNLRSMSSTFSTSKGNIEEAIAHIESHNEGAAVDSFKDTATGDDADTATLGRFGEGTEIAAGACETCAHATVVFKGVVIAQLALLAPAIAAGPVSFFLKRGVEYAIEKALEAAINEILGGE